MSHFGRVVQATAGIPGEHGSSCALADCFFTPRADGARGAGGRKSFRVVRLRVRVAAGRSSVRIPRRAVRAARRPRAEPTPHPPSTMNVGKVFLFAAVAAVAIVATLIVAGPSDAPSNQAPAAFPPAQSPQAPMDASDLFRTEESLPRFQPRHPELAFVEHSDGLPQSGTWRGYPLLHDFNGDGRADLVASNREEDGYGVWMAPAKGPWMRSVDGPKKDFGGIPPDMAYGPARAADIDGDGRTDLLLSAHSDALRLYRNVLAEGPDGQPVDDGKLHWLR